MMPGFPFYAAAALLALQAALAIGNPASAARADSSLTVDYCQKNQKCNDSTLRAVNDAGVTVGDFVTRQLYRLTPETLETRGISHPVQFGFVHQGGTDTLVIPPFKDGYDTHLLAIDNHNRVLVHQFFQGNHWYLFDLGTHQFTPLDGAGILQTAAGTQSIRVQKFVGLLDDGRVFAVFNGPKGECAIAGRPAVAPAPGSAPAAPGSYSLIGCPEPPLRMRLDIVASNARGQIVGNTNTLKAFLWDKGTLTILSCRNSPVTEAHAVSSAGAVLGAFQETETSHKGFAYIGGKYSVIDFPQAKTLAVLGVNSKNEVVGEYTGARGGHDGFILHSFALD